MLWFEAFFMRRQDGAGFGVPTIFFASLLLSYLFLLGTFFSSPHNPHADAVGCFEGALFAQKFGMGSSTVFSPHRVSIFFGVVSPPLSPFNYDGVVGGDV